MDLNSRIEIPINRVDCDDIIYSINEEEKTASVIGCYTNGTKIMIPRQIKYGSNEYIVISILKDAFKKSSVKMIQFAADSELKMIDSEAFKGALIEYIAIPSKVAELKDGWCFNMINLKRFDVSPDNPYFSAYENKFIIGKKSIEQRNYDHLVFCARNVKNAKIPKFIKHICPYAFEGCIQLKRIEIEHESNLQTIGKNSFYQSSIESIIIPSQVTQIQGGAFYDCDKLHKIEIRNDSKLQVIGKYAFYKTSIGSIAIPSHISQIDNHAFHYCDKLKIIEFAFNSQIGYYGKFEVPESTVVMFPANSINRFIIYSF